jgi:transketolase
MQSTTFTRGQTLAMGESEKLPERDGIEAPFGKELLEVARERNNVVGLTADLGKYTAIFPFRDAFPDRFFNVGMAEQNLVAVAAGMARTGLIPFATTYGVFATRRAYDFIAIACAHGRVNVKIVAGLPGLTTGYGGTHQAIEDLTLMCAVPNLTVIDPCDATEIQQVTHAIAAYDGPVYMRLLRGRVPIVLDPANYRFELGRAVWLRQGSDVGIISTGLMTERALDASDALAQVGIRAAVLHVPTLKPFDKEAVCALAGSARTLVSVENHVVTGGLGTMVADTLVAHRISKPLLKIGIPDKFVECGSVQYLQAKYGLLFQDIVANIKRELDG